MGFWSWLLGNARSTKSVPPQSPDDKDLTYVDLPGPGTYQGDIVGESHYQDALNAICGGKTERGHHKIVKALLVCEDAKPTSNLKEPSLRCGSYQRVP
jgi:hypothetical protein